jgi:hypothetical protein
MSLLNILKMKLGNNDVSRGVTEPAATIATVHCDRDVYSVLTPVANTQLLKP